MSLKNIKDINGGIAAKTWGGPQTWGSTQMWGGILLSILIDLKTSAINIVDLKGSLNIIMDLVEPVIVIVPPGTGNVIANGFFIFITYP